MINSPKVRRTLDDIIAKLPLLRQIEIEQKSKILVDEMKKEILNKEKGPI